MIETLTNGFRERFLDHETLTRQLRAWADAFPHVVRLRSIGTSSEGRELWLLELGPDPERIRPAVWIDGNMHAGELCGSSVALAIAEDVIRLHVAPDAPTHGLAPSVAARLKDVLFYVMPRMSPDGAEEVLRTGRYVRSSLRDARPDRLAPRWASRDLDGDGLSLVMRVADPTGEFVEDATFPGLLVPRRLEDEGPFYKVYPEGVIEGFDGHTIPSSPFTREFPIDLNRNFPWAWMPEPDQIGAGAFPGSEPESRAVIETTSASPHIFAWLNLHTFGGCFIRPLGHQPDSKMDQQDLAIYRQVAAWGEEHTGYPTVSGFEEFTYEPDKPLHGEMTDYAYHQRGCIAYVCELWDLFKRIGMERPKKFVDHYTHLTRDDLRRLARWDREHNSGRCVRPWVKVRHPQLGDVEVGGLDPRVGMWNPPYEEIAEVCRAQAAAFLRVAAMAPRLVVAAQASPAGEGVARVEVRVENHGYLPTYVLASARKLAWNEPLFLDVDAQGCELVEPRHGRLEIGHLEGWGRGLFSGSDAIYYMRSQGNAGSRRAVLLARGSGRLHVRAGSCRTGWVDATVEV